MLCDSSVLAQKLDIKAYRLAKKIALAGALCLSLIHASHAQVSQPNIIFIFADDWGWGDLGAHGSEKYATPNIDRLAAEGIDFYQFSVASPVCSPSRASVMTGRFPARDNIRQHFATIEHHQQANMPDWLDPAQPMLPRVLQKAGYATAHFGKWHLTNVQITDAPLPTEYGFDEFGAFNLPGINMPPAETADRAIDFIERNKDRPFFINLWIHETHTPHYPEPILMKEYGHLPEQQMLYASIVAAGDRDVGKVLDSLDKLEIADNTIVIFSSDNGPEFPNKIKYMDDDSTGPGFGRWYSVGETLGLLGRKRSLYAGGIRTPFIIRWPRVTPAGKRDQNSIIAAVDIFPTLVDIAGASLPEDYVSDGENIRAAISGQTFERSLPLYWVWPPGAEEDSTDSMTWPEHAIQSEGWKLLVNNRLQKTALFNVKKDWYEKNDLSSQNPKIVEKLLAQLDQIRIQMPTSPNPKAMSSLRTQGLMETIKNDR